MLDRGLIEPGQGGGLELEAVVAQIARDGFLHALHEIGALLLEVGQAHAGGDGAQGVHELRFDQFTQKVLSLIHI